MRIGSFNTDEHVLLIAEIGNNHEGSVTLAEELIGLAARAGADAVKFQTIVPERLVSPRQDRRLEQLRRLCLSYADFERLSAVAAREGVMFLSTPFDIESAKFIAPLVPAIKIASGDNDFVPLLQAAAAAAKPILLSCGLADIAHVQSAMHVIESEWKLRCVEASIAVLHCVVSYPAPACEANLLAMRSLAQLGVTIGYSDHTCGLDAAVLSVALGARLIEKHFTISKTYSDFRDHQLSADPSDFAELVARVRSAETLLGDGRKRIMECEVPLRENVRRSIVAARDLGLGDVIHWRDLDWLRPGDGLPCGQEEQLLGRSVRRTVKRGEAITLGHCAD